MLMLSVLVNVRMCGEVGEKGGASDQARGRKTGQLIPSMGLARAEVCIKVQWATTSRKRALIYVY